MIEQDPFHVDTPSSTPLGSEPSAPIPDFESHPDAENTSTLDLVFSVLRRQVQQFRLERAKVKLAKLEISRGVFKEMPDVYGNRIQCNLGTTETKQRDVNPDLAHVSRGEIQQGKRAGRRVAKSNAIRSTTMRRLLTAWPNLDPELQERIKNNIRKREEQYDMDFHDEEGNSLFLRRIENSRLPLKEKARAREDYRQYMKLKKKGKSLDRKVQNSAEGLDIPGKRITKRINKSTLKIEGLESKLNV